MFNSKLWRNQYDHDILHLEMEMVVKEENLFTWSQIGPLNRLQSCGIPTKDNWVNIICKAEKLRKVKNVQACNNND